MQDPELAAYWPGKYIYALSFAIGGQRMMQGKNL